MKALISKTNIKSMGSTKKLEDKLRRVVSRETSLVTTVFLLSNLKKKTMSMGWLFFFPLVFLSMMHCWVWLCFTQETAFEQCQLVEEICRNSLDMG